MADHFFDTRAVSKHYQQEPGTAVVDGLIAGGGLNLISRLGVTELHSALAKKVRAGAMTRTDFDRVTRRFRGDIRAGRLRVARLLVRHHVAAERLIRRVGVSKNPRTLDALRLAVALSVNEPARPVVFVRADQTLCTIAVAEGLTVVNPR